MNDICVERENALQKIKHYAEEKMYIVSEIASSKIKGFISGASFIIRSSDTVFRINLSAQICILNIDMAVLENGYLIQKYKIINKYDHTILALDREIEKYRAFPDLIKYANVEQQYLSLLSQKDKEIIELNQDYEPEKAYISAQLRLLNNETKRDLDDKL